MMQRDLSRLTGTPFDLLVVGGGVYGLAAAYDAAQRGLRVALVERGDFGSGSSFNHQKTAHGGLRYLQTGDVRRARESVLERRTLARIAPHLLHPLAFVLPTVRSPTAGRLALRTGFLLDRIVARDRNVGLPAALRLPAGRVISRDDCLRRFPGVRRKGLTGAGLWYDYQMSDAERLTMAIAVAAEGHGAVLANHAEAIAPRREQGRITGMTVRDALSGSTLEVAARVILNAAGAGAGPLMAACGVARPVPLVQAMNFVTSRDATDAALGARSPSGRHLFLVPWRRHALIGTWEAGVTCQPDARITSAQVAAFLAEINQAFPALDLAPGEIRMVHRGVVPAEVAADGRVSLRGRHEIRDHAQDGADGLVTVIGVKYTTARAVAQEAIDVIVGRLGGPAAACRTAVVPLPGGEIPDAGAVREQVRAAARDRLPPEVLAHLVDAYGARAQAVVDLLSEQAAWAEPIGGTHPVIAAELIHAVRYEMACTLTDALVRRTGLGADGFPGEAAAGAAARLLAAELGWDAPRVARELAALRAFYEPLEIPTPLAAP